MYTLRQCFSSHTSLMSMGTFFSTLQLLKNNNDVLKKLIKLFSVQDVLIEILFVVNFQTKCG